MLINQFILENVHFAIYVFASLVFFAVGWLYLDAYLETKVKKVIIKVIGFSLLALAFILGATYIEEPILTTASVNFYYIGFLSSILKFAGYILIITGLLVDPIQKKPSATQQVKSAAVFPIFSLSNAQIGLSTFPILSLSIFFLYLRRVTFGLEKHLKNLAVGFFFITIFETLNLLEIFQNVNTISIYNLFKPLGPVWIIGNVILFVGIAIIAKWVFQYLLRRIQTEIFMIINTAWILIFLVTTVLFTGLLLNNLRDDALRHLDTDVNVVNYAITSKQNQALSDAEVVSQNTSLINAIAAKDTKALKNISTTDLLAKKESFLIIVASSGAVLMRGEDNEKTGDSLSQDPLFIRTMRGEKVSSIIVKEGPIAPVVSIRSAVPIESAGQRIGAVIVGIDIDNAFVDGLKNSTHLDTSVYGDNILSATTFVAPDGKSRSIGIKELDKNINRTVLIEGKNYTGEDNILNVPYFAAFAPLKDTDGNPVGMIFVGQEQVSVIQTAAASIEYTFLISVIFIILSIVPSYLVSQFITKQFK